MFQREVVEDILGDDGLRIMEGAMESLVEEQVASSADDVVDENLRVTSEEDNGDTQVKDATPSSSSTSIIASSSSSPLTPSNCLNRIMTGSWTPSSATEALQDIPGFNLSSWRILDSNGRRNGNILLHRGKFFDGGLRHQRPILNIDIVEKSISGRCDGHSLDNFWHKSHS